MDRQKWAPRLRIAVGLLIAVGITQALLLWVMPEPDLHRHSTDVWALLEGLRSSFAMLMAVFVGALVARQGLFWPSAVLVSLLWLYIVGLLSSFSIVSGAAYGEVIAGSLRYHLPGYLLNLFAVWLGVKLAALCLRKASIAAA